MGIKLKMTFPHILDIEIKGSTSVNVVIPPEIDGVEVKTIPANLFYNTDIKSLSIPASVEVIYENAFESCSKLKSIKIEDNSQLYSICEKAFCNTRITSFPFEKCRKLHFIKDGAFAYTNITKADLSNTDVEFIPDGCFTNSSLEQVMFPKQLSCIGQEAFKNNKLHSVDFSKITEETLFLKPFSFSNCHYLKEVIFSENKTSIGTFAFACCVSLKELRIPKNVKMESGSFYKCDFLEKVVFEEGVPVNNTIPESAFEDCINLRTVIIDADYETIDKAAFKYCCKLKDVKLPKTLTIIKDAAFCGCFDLENIDLRGCSMEYIGFESFDSSKVSIESIYLDYLTGVNISKAFNAHCGVLEYERVKEKYPFCVIT